ncbi:hypothetical protein AB5I41_00720 [Sphingomonas sp. MMS24-JH45]
MKFAGGEPRLPQEHRQQFAVPRHHRRLPVRRRLRPCAGHDRELRYVEAPGTRRLGAVRAAAGSLKLPFDPRTGRFVLPNGGARRTASPRARPRARRWASPASCSASTSSPRSTWANRTAR